ncbi:hypothetical protein ACH5RR_021994 [Cinchona calisaya]|uniref:F-box domain-containing protein n=1 Tax=Cinchona calisaya TaxID=153742 RepID=A0ABD2Z9S2_9GENT
MEKAIETTQDDADDYGVNRINALPDDILSHILSFLTARESAATSVLSTRWRYLFIWHPDIDLQYRRPNMKLKGNYSDAFKLFSDFKSFANRLVLLRNGAPVRKLKLSFAFLLEDFEVALDSLISAVLEFCQLQQLEIFVDEHFLYRNALSSPEGLFTCKTLTCLRLEWPKVRLNVPDWACLPNLKELCLVESVFFDDGSIQRLVQGCPLIQELVLHCLLGRDLHDKDAYIQIEIRDIFNPCLKKLVLSFQGNLRTDIVVESKNLESLEYRVIQRVREHKISIDAPNIKYLDWSGCLCGAKFILQPKFLVRAKIDLDIGNPSSQDAFKFLNEVKSVESLCLVAPSPVMPCVMKEECLYGQMPCVMKEERVLLCPKLFPRCPIKHLKEIEFTEFCKCELESKLVEYPLQNGKVLKKMMVGRSFAKWKSLQVAKE